MPAEKAFLGLLDYFSFAAMLLCSAGIGIYFRFAGTKRNTTDEFLLAGKNMAILPVAFSLMATDLSAITVLGIPAEMYNFGVALTLASVGHATGKFISSYIFLPVYFDMQVTTAYEYLEKRFGRKTRILCSISFVAQVVLYMSVILYAPALALSAVTNLSTWASVISIGAVCTFYCTLGGMKAVLWTDVLQGVLMFLCLFAVLIKGCMDVGGIRNVFRIAREGGRLQMPGFETDPTVRYTVWNIILYSVLMHLSVAGTNQLQVQRLLTVRNLKRSRMALVLSLPMSVAFHLLCCLVGIVIYANFAYCDPLTSEKNPISSPDQLLPYYVMKSLGHFPGLAGICFCGVFAASLSSVSSVVNSLTAVTMEDFLKPFCNIEGTKQWKVAMLSKAITLFYGLLCVSMTFLISNFGNIIQACIILFSIFAGPVLGVFVLGMLTTRSNEKGAIIGLVTSLSLTAWMSFGAAHSGLRPEVLSVSTSGCPHVDLNQTYIVEVALENITHAIYEDFTTATHPPPIQDVRNVSEFPSYLNYSDAAKGENDSYIFPLYRISFMWYIVLGFLTSVAVGYAVSVFTDLAEGKTSSTKPEYLSPVVRWWFIRNDETRKEKSTKTKAMKIFNEPNQTVL